MLEGEKSGFDAAAEAGESSQTDTEQIKPDETGENVKDYEALGRERAQKAAEWIGSQMDGAKTAVAKGGKFLKKLGFNILSLPERGIDAAKAAGEAGIKAGHTALGAATEAYRFVSESTSEAARNTAERMKGAYERAGAARERIIDGAKEKMNGWYDGAKQTRDSSVQFVRGAAKETLARLLDRKIAKQERIERFYEERIKEIQDARAAIKTRQAELRGGNQTAQAV